MTNTMNTPPCIYRSGCQRRDCGDICLGLHSNREKQATQAPSNSLVLRLRAKEAGSTTEDANLMEEAALEIELLENRVARLRATGEPPEEPSVMGGMLSQPRPPVPSGVKLIEWCVQQIQITCDALNLDPTQWLNDSTAQDDSAQPPATALQTQQVRDWFADHCGDLPDDAYHALANIIGDPDVKRAWSARRATATKEVR